MACLGTRFTATGTTANRRAYPQGLSSINNVHLRPICSFSPLPTLPQPLTSKRLSNESVSSVGRGRGRVLLIARAEAKAMTSIEKSGIKIIKNPPESKLADLGVRSWPKWGCDPSKFPWTYSLKETCFLLKGKVKVYPDGSDEAVEIGAGDLVEFPAGMSCTWDVSETVDKHYKFD